MKHYKNVLIIVFLMTFLTACQSDSLVRKERVVIEPPKVYLEPCERSLGNGTVNDVLVGLDNTVRCYETKQDALRSWVEDLKNDKEGNDA